MEQGRRVGRRGVLAGIVATLAGCSTVEERLEEVTGPDGHPLEGTTTVTVENRSDSSHDLETLAADALTFWEENTPEFAGFSVEYRRAEETSADLEIVFLDSREELQGCGEYATDDILGCAPILTEESRFDPPATVEVVATDRPYGEVEITTKHELGHTLGLGHDDEPAYIMSNDIEDRLPEYESRTAIVDAFEEAWTARNEGTELHNEAVGEFEDEAYESAAETFRDSESRYATIHEYMSTAEAEATAFESMERPDTVDRAALEDHIERAREAADLAAEAASLMAESAEAAADGDRRTARDRQQAANDVLEELREIGFPSPRDAALAVGLTRERELESD